MYVFHSTVRVKTGREADFISSNQGARDPILSAPGFVKRLLLRDKEHPGTFFYMSFWRAFEDLEAYRATQVVKDRVSQLKDLDLFAAPIDRVECEIITDDVRPPAL